MLSPNHIYLAVNKAVEDNVKAPSGKLEGELYAVLQGNGVSDNVLRAYDIFSYAFKRETLESLLLAGATPKEIEKTVGVKIQVVEIYGYLFFDVGVFENMLDRLEYAGSYTDSKYGQEMKQLAVNLGKEVLKVRLSQGAYSVTPETAIDAIRGTAYMMAQLAKANPIDSVVAREAQRWAQICLKASDGDKEARTEDAASLRIELEKHEVSVDEKKSGIPSDEILH
jgi:hypothetical protein